MSLFHNGKMSQNIFSPYNKNFFGSCRIILYDFKRNLYSIKKNINLNFLFPVNFIIITFFSFILDAVKTLVFFYSVLRYQKINNTKKNSNNININNMI